jgi:endonuclease YncB( thermonuclease family)
MLLGVLIGLFLLAGPVGFTQSADEILVGKVLTVGDGDTFYLRTQDGRELWIALWGVECPGVGEKIGNKARAFAQKAVLGKEIGFQMVVPREETERSYGRVVYRGTRDLALELLRKGLAVWVPSVAPQAYEYEEAQLMAQEARLGVWKLLMPEEDEDEEKTEETG